MALKDRLEVDCHLPPLWYILNIIIGGIAIVGAKWNLQPNI